MIKYMPLLFCFTLLLFLLLPNDVLANCQKFDSVVKKAFYKYFGDTFPYWFSIATLEVESNCKWIDKSLDGHGSIGYAQLTEKFLDQDGSLSKLFPDWKKPYSSDHFYAFAYVIKNKHRLNKSPDKKLWLTYQMYNSGYHPVLDCLRINSWRWEDCKYSCSKCRELGGKKCRGEVCVWKEGSQCKQKRHACDINYTYSVKIWNYSHKYKPVNFHSNWIFW